MDINKLSDSELVDYYRKLNGIEFYVDRIDYREIPRLNADNFGIKIVRVEQNPLNYLV